MTNQVFPQALGAGNSEPAPSFAQPAVALAESTCGVCSRDRLSCVCFDAVDCRCFRIDGDVDNTSECPIHGPGSEEPEPEPPCACIFEGDSGDSSNCPLHGPGSEIERAAMRREAESEREYWQDFADAWQDEKRDAGRQPKEWDETEAPGRRI